MLIQQEFHLVTSQHTIRLILLSDGHNDGATPEDDRARNEDRKLEVLGTSIIYGCFSAWSLGCQLRRVLVFLWFGGLEATVFGDFYSDGQVFFLAADHFDELHRVHDGAVGYAEAVLASGHRGKPEAAVFTSPGVMPRFFLRSASAI